MAANPAMPKSPEALGLVWLCQRAAVQQTKPSKLVINIETSRPLAPEDSPRKWSAMAVAVDCTVNAMNISASLVSLAFLASLLFSTSTTLPWPSLPPSSPFPFPYPPPPMPPPMSTSLSPSPPIPLSLPSP
jgi:hypothetical protein